MNGLETKSIEVGSTLVEGYIMNKCYVWDIIRPPLFQTCKDPITLEIEEDRVFTLDNGAPWLPLSWPSQKFVCEYKQIVT